MTSQPPSRLGRRLGVGAAVAVGLGAMLGTGVFAAWTPAVGFAGNALLWALLAAAVIAGLNAWSSVRLAAAHPMSGGSYAYGRRWCGRRTGVAAGVSFVIGKSASAGAAALTIGSYVAPAQQRWVAVAAVLVVLVINLRGVVTTAVVSAVLSGAVIAVLLVVVAGTSTLPVAPAVPLESHGLSGGLAATAVLFVAFAGYARITVLGEEVSHPARTIPRAVVISLLIVLAVYALVALAVLRAVNGGVALSPSPLHDIARAVAFPGLTPLVTLAATVAAGAALLSLIGGVGRTLFAMAGGGDAPAALSRVGTMSTPVAGEIVATVFALVVVMLGGIGGALALSAGSIGVYYAVAHLSALRMSATERRPPTWVPFAGLVGCAVLIAGAVLALV